ncbi:MAG: hypothetical protein CM1200mP9_04490 [Gammaproteobacteria bacterium]|nr:MAG: hypothetical protein CM1200mP9_04490 [Gammaproteobacteria bacterium]
MTEWEPVIGLKGSCSACDTLQDIFTRCYDLRKYPNSNANGVDIALPGVLPVLNEEAVRMASSSVSRSTPK